MITRRSFLAKIATLTGSVAFGVATHRSDEDWLITADGLSSLGISLDGTNDYGDYPAEFATYREGRLNLIVALTPEFHQRWMKAHRHCKIERPRNRTRRIKIFRHYLYGESFLT